PIWYIYSNNHKPEKLGFSSDSKKNRFALMIGIAGGLLLILISLGTTILNTFLATSGLDFFDMSGYIAEENTIIREAGLPWLFLLMALLTLASISSELVFRGVLHNALKEKLEDSPLAREYTILMIALIYAAIYTLFCFPIGLVYFLGNFLTFALLGILYELNENLLNTIIASVFYNILLVVLIFL
ncbi:MAG: CPBP family intramembrane metalloprotease, partial [Promethearchaeota archaeon]